MNRVFLLIITAGVLIGLGFFLIKSYGKSEYERGYVSAIAKVNQAAIKSAKRMRDNEIKIRQLDNDDLVRRYCHWVYGTTYDECVRTYKFVD